MTKARTKAQRRRFRQLSDVGLPELEPSRKRGKDGCFQERTRQQAADPNPRETVLSARCRHLGKEDTEENRLSVVWSILGDPAGRAISIGAKSADDRDRMWKTFSRLDASVAVYHHRILGQRRFPKCGKMEHIPERFSTQPEDAPTDARDDETKDRDAVSTWMRWQGYIGRLASHEQRQIWDAVWLRVELSKGGRLTTAGTSFVMALRTLASISGIR